jgi:transposase-like protein
LLDFGLDSSIMIYMDTKDINPKKRPELEQSEIIEALPKACSDETAAVEFLELRLWGATPCCPKCGDINVYKMVDAKTGERSKRFLWRCRGCKKMYTVRTNTVFEESLIPLRHWCYAFWRVSTSKKGVAAMEIMRQCQITYKSALFMLHRLRFALTPSTPVKLKGVVEFDETYVGGKPRKYTGYHKRGRGTPKTPVFGMVERGGNIHRRVVADVSGLTLKKAIFEMVDRGSDFMSDENGSYSTIGKWFASHQTVSHSAGEYVRGDVHNNTMESSFAIVKRGLIGIHHAVSKEHLHRYLAHYDFLWNCRKMNDGQRAALAIESSQGKRLMYKEPRAN